MTKSYQHQNGHPFQTLIDEVLNTSISELFGHSVTTRQPHVNIMEVDNKFIIELVSPGLQKKDFNVSVLDEKLQIKVDKGGDSSNVNTSINKREWSYDQWTRTISLGTKADFSKIEAKYDLGILTIEVEKKDPSHFVSNIKIK